VEVLSASTVPIFIKEKGRVFEYHPLENLRTRMQLSGLGRAALWVAIPSKVDRIIRRREYAAQILESLRFIAVHGFDHEGLEL
jgi:hypothetical protein